MGRTNHSYNGMLSAIARKSLPRFTNYAKDTASLSTIFGNEYSTINKRGNDSLTNIISADFDTPEEYIKETNVGPIITLNGDRTVTMTAGEDYTDLGATADGDEEVTVDTSNLDTTVVGTYTVSYSATDTEGYTRVENRFVKVVAPEEWTPGYTTVPVTLGDKLHLNVSSLTLGQKYVFDFSQTRGKDFRLSNDGTTELTDGVIEAENTLVYTVPSDFNLPLYYYSPNTPNIGGYFRVNNVVYSDQGILKIGGVSSLTRGQEYIFYFSSDYGTNIALSTSLNGANLTEGISNTETTLTVTLPLFYPFDNIYIKSLDTPDIGSQLGVTGSMTTGTIYFDNNGKLRASGITSFNRGQEYTFYFSSDYGTKVLLALTEDGNTFEQGVTSNTDTSLVFTVPTTNTIDTIYIKSPTTQGIGSSFPTRSLETKLLASDGAADDYFGYSASISGDGLTAIVGAYADDGVNNNLSYSGSAYIFKYANGSWTETKLTADDGVAYDYFGRSVSISGDGLTAIVGAYRDDSIKGSAYIFKYANGSWSQKEKLTADDGVTSDRFGYSVSISGDGLTAIVGAYGDDSSRGSAYIFKYANGSWTETKLTADDGAADDYFGYSVSISGDGLTAIVGAYGDDGVNNNLGNSGSAYIFKYANGSWSQKEKLTADDGAASDYFGRSVSISGDGLTAIMAAYGDDGVNNNLSYSGSAYIFKYANGSWTETKLTADDGVAYDYFGNSVSISGDGLTAIVGAYRDDSNKGSAYIFKYANGSWSQKEKLTADDGVTPDRFGRSVSISSDGLTAIVGAYLDDDNGSNSGSAYIYNYL